MRMLPPALKLPSLRLAAWPPARATLDPARIGLALLKHVAWLVLGLILLLFTLLFPILILAICAVTISLISFRKSTSIGIATTVLVTIFLAWVNSGKLNSGDFSWYANHYELLSRIPLTNYLGHQVNQFTIKAREPFYYTMAFLLSRLTGANVMALNLFISCWVSGLTGAAYTLMARNLRLSPGHTALFVFTGMMISTTFTLSTHLVRQEFAGCALLLGVTCLYLQHRKTALAFLIIAAASHESAYVPIIAIVAGTLIVKRFGTFGTSRAGTLVQAVAMVLFAGLGYYYANHVVTDSPFQPVRSDGEINTITYTVDAILFTAAALTIRYSPANLKTKAIMSVVALYMAFLLGLSSQPLPLLRMYFYLDLVRGASSAYIAWRLLQTRHGPLWVAPIALTALAYTELRILSSSFRYYGGGLISHLLFPSFLV